MANSTRKAFLQTMGFAGATGLLYGAVPVTSIKANEGIVLNTEPAKTGIAKRVLRVANLTDIHVRPDRTAEYGMAAALNTVNSMADTPDFIINGGDAIMNAAALTKGVIKEQWQVFNSIMKNENSMPVYHCIGNHDLYGFLLPSADHTESKLWAMDEYRMSNRYYSFVKSNWKFVVLDSVHARKSVPGYYGKLDEEQFIWLKNELKQTPANLHVCIVSHIPILAICCLFDRDITNTDHMRISESNMHQDCNELVGLFYQYKNVKACLSGHIHLVDYVNYLGVEYFCNGAVAGEWWKGKHNQFDPAFCVMNFYEDGTVTREVNYYKWQI